MAPVQNNSNSPQTLICMLFFSVCVCVSTTEPHTNLKRTVQCRSGCICMDPDCSGKGLTQNQQLQELILHSVTVSGVKLTTPTEDDLIKWPRRGGDVRQPQHERSHTHVSLQIALLVFYTESISGLPCITLIDAIRPPLDVLYVTNSSCTGNIFIWYLLGQNFWICHGVMLLGVGTATGSALTGIWDSLCLFHCSTYSPASNTNVNANARCWRLNELLGI